MLSPNALALMSGSQTSLTVRYLQYMASATCGARCSYDTSRCSTRSSPGQTRSDRFLPPSSSGRKDGVLEEDQVLLDPLDLHPWDDWLSPSRGRPPGYRGILFHSTHRRLRIISAPSSWLRSRPNTVTRVSALLGRPYLLLQVYRLSPFVCRYCFGGAISIRLAPLDAITSIFIAHPAPSTLDNIKAINVRAA